MPPKTTTSPHLMTPAELLLQSTRHPHVMSSNFPSAPQPTTVAPSQIMIHLPPPEIHGQFTVVPQPPPSGTVITPKPAMLPRRPSISESTLPTRPGAPGPQQSIPSYAYPHHLEQYLSLPPVVPSQPRHAASSSTWLPPPTAGRYLPSEARIYINPAEFSRTDLEALGAL